MPETKRPTIPAAEEILNGYFPVLDHGFIALKDYMGGDDAIEEAARLSYTYGTRKTSEQRHLLRYLKRQDHTSPFEMVEVKIHVAMPIFVARQWVRQRTASLNEQSGRYSLLPMAFYTPDREHFALQASDNKQGRQNTAVDEFTYDTAVYGMQTVRDFAEKNYEWLTQEGIARELARIDLPLSIYTQWIWKIDLNNLFKFLTKRTDSHAQYEIRAYANIIAGMVQRIAPLAFEAWMDYDIMGARLSRGELALIQKFVGADVYPDGFDLYGKDNQYAGTEEEFGLSKRELNEFIQKLQFREAPDFTLDLSQMKTPDYFEQRMAALVPK